MADATASAAADEALRREKLKAAGAAYFERLLAAEEAQHAVAVDKPQNGPINRPTVTSFDADFLQVEAVVEGSRTYVLGTLLVISNAVSLVFAKASVDALATPILLSSLHMLPTAAALWLLAAQGVISLRPLSARALQGAAPTTLIAAVRAVALLTAAVHCTLWLLLAWTVMVPLVVKAVQEVQLSGARPGPAPLAGLAVGLLATAMAVVVAPSPGLTGLVALLLWAAAEAAAAGWGQLRQRPELLAALLGEARAAPLRVMLEAESSLDDASLAFLQQALPPLPLLLLGLLLGEGSELVDHELSVPAVSKILLSILAWAASAVCSLLTADCLTRQARAALLAAAPLGTVVTEAAVQGVAAGQALGLVAAVVAAVAGLALRLAAVANA